MEKKILIERIQNLTRTLTPIPIDHTTRLDKLHGIKCVAFDFYGTMFISGVGDIGVDEDQQAANESSFREALVDSGFEITNDEAEISGPRIFQKVINKHINASKESGIEVPEPDIIQVWLDVLRELKRECFIKGEVDKNRAIRFAIEFEFRVNSIWPVPELAQLIQHLKERGLELGIISNSQFYTPLAFEALIGRPLEDAGFDPDLLKWSYVSGLKKPSIRFYELFVNALKDKDFGPGEVLYIGNDVRKDIQPAKELGMKTALYVGDERSIRHSPSDLEKEEFNPDIIINDLNQIIGCLSATEPA